MHTVCTPNARLVRVELSSEKKPVEAGVERICKQHLAGGFCLHLTLVSQDCKIGAPLDASDSIPCALTMSYQDNTLVALDGRQCIICWYTDLQLTFQTGVLHGPACACYCCCHDHKLGPMESEFRRIAARDNAGRSQPRGTQRNKERNASVRHHCTGLRHAGLLHRQRATLKSPAIQRQLPSLNGGATPPPRSQKLLHLLISSASCSMEVYISPQHNADLLLPQEEHVEDDDDDDDDIS